MPHDILTLSSMLKLHRKIRLVNLAEIKEIEVLDLSNHGVSLSFDAMNSKYPADIKEDQLFKKGLLYQIDQG